MAIRKLPHPERARSAQSKDARCTSQRTFQVFHTLIRGMTTEEWLPPYAIAPRFKGGATQRAARGKSTTAFSAPVLAHGGGELLRVVGIAVQAVDGHLMHRRARRGEPDRRIGFGVIDPNQHTIGRVGE
jgi:hypothetical protein